MTATSGPAVTLLDLSDGALTTLLDEHDIYGGMTLAGTADGLTLLAFRGGDLHGWNASTGAPVPMALPSGFAFRSLFGIDASGTLLGISVDDYQTVSTHLQVWRLGDGALVRDVPLDDGLRPGARASPVRTPALRGPAIRRDRKSTRLNSSHPPESRMPSSA